MIDLEAAVNGVGRLRARHVSGAEGILLSVSLAEALYLGGLSPVPPEAGSHTYTIALDGGGKLEAPQRDFEAVT